MGFNSKAAAVPSIARLGRGALSVSPVSNLNVETVFNDVLGRPEIAARFIAPGRAQVKAEGAGVSILMSEGKIAYNGRSVESGAVMVGGGKEASFELGRLGLLLRVLTDASELGMEGRIRAISGAVARQLMGDWGAPLKLVVPELRANESHWHEEMWDFSVDGSTAVRPVILNERDRLQFSINNGRGKETYHAHQFATEYLVMLEGSMRLWSSAHPMRRTLEAPFVLAVDAWMSHMVKTDGISYALQAAVQDGPAGNVTVSSSREERHADPDGPYDPSWRSRDRRLSDPAARLESFIRLRDIGRV